MDKRQAQEILRLYRPGVADTADDPQMARALELARQDPELAAWFENHCAVFTALRAKLRQVQPPGDLQARILARVPAPGKVVPFRQPGLWLLAAAAVVIMSGLLWFVLLPRLDTFPAFRDHMARIPQRGYSMSLISTNLSDIRHYFREKQFDADYSLTPQMEKLGGQGCALLEWHGKKVSMVCLQKDLFLFIGKISDWSHPPPPGKADVAHVVNMDAVSWSQGDRVYVLAGPGTPEELKAYAP